jgi:very-short-patch-repair endonuclease
VFKKGNIPWNIGKHGYSCPQPNHKSWNKGHKTRVIVKCLFCKKEEEVPPSYSKTYKYCSRACQWSCNIFKEKERKARLKQRFLKSGTGLENALEDILKELNINYISQYVIPEAKCIADFAIPNEKTLFFADGKYWHSLEKRKIKDSEQRSFLLNNGWKYISLSEDELKSPLYCKYIIGAFLS